MNAICGFRALKRIISQHGVTNHSLRSITSGPLPVKRSDDMPVHMENPYKQPEKGCVLTGVTVDYRNIQLLSQFISPHTGRIYGRHITGLCGKKQKEVSKAIKKSIAMGFMSVTHKHPQLMKDPNICDIRQLD